MTAWIGVASADHGARGRAGGFMQLSHGKAAPIRRVKPGDRIAYYSPLRVYGETEPCRAFTGLGTVGEGEPYQVEMAACFAPWRRDVDWRETRAAPIAPLLDRLRLTAGQRNWGAPFRYGLVRIDEADMRLIEDAMGVVP